MSTLPVYSIPKVDGKLDKDAPVIRDQEITQTGFSYPGDVPQGETNYSFYVIKESDRKPILIGTGDVIVSKDGSFFYVADADADPSLQFKDVKELQSKDNVYKVIGLAYIAPPSQNKTLGDRQEETAIAESMAQDAALDL